MARIYSSCQLAIAPTGTEDCSAGCLFEWWTWTDSWSIDSVYETGRRRISLKTVKLSSPEASEDPSITYDLFTKMHMKMSLIPRLMKLLLLYGRGHRHSRKAF